MKNQLKKFDFLKSINYLLLKKKLYIYNKEYNPAADEKSSDIFKNKYVL